MSKIVVVMSTYNGEQYLQEQIDSIIGQQGCEVSLLVRDDGSSDNTIHILREYERQGKLKCIQGENKRPARSFLTALMQAEDADYYAFADQDDIWEAEKLKNAVEWLDRENVNTPNLYCCNLTPVDSNGRIIQDKLLPEKIVTDYQEVLIRSPHIFGCTMVFNRAMRDYILQRPLPQYALMHDMWLVLIASALGVIVYNDKPYIRYRQHGHNCIGASIRKKEKWKKRMQTVTQKPDVSRADQAAEFVEYVGERELHNRGLLAYTKLVANYRDGIKGKLDYLMHINHSAMNLKQYLFHVLTVILNKL